MQNFRQLTELQPAEGPTRVSDMRSATFEDGDGKNFAFDMQTNVDNAQNDIIDGKATKAAEGALSIALSKPKPGKLNLDTDVVFPTEHLRRILDAAEDGRNILQLTVYDGSETGDKLYETTTIIGHSISAPVVEQAAHIPALENMKRWPVSISYFEVGKKDEGPNYILSFDLYENGISRALKLDYGDFILGGEMTSSNFCRSRPARNKIAPPARVASVFCGALLKKARRGMRVLLCVAVAWVDGEDGEQPIRDGWFASTPPIVSASTFPEGILLRCIIQG